MNMNIIFVCTGNTCRSPLAEGLMKKKLNNLGFKNISITSAGLAACSGDEVSANSVEAAKKYGVDISAHRARPLSPYMLEDGVFFCMSQSHIAALMPYVEGGRLFLLGGGIADPFLGSQEIYDRCAAQINSALDEAIKTLILSFTEIVPMNKGHIADIAEIERLCFSLPWSEKSLEEELENSNAHFLAAEFCGRALGYIGIIEICGEADITNIAVHPDFRRLKIAERLLNFAENGARERGCESITLEVRESNSAAIELYKKFGWERVGLRKDFYEKPKENAILMTKYLNGENEK